MTFDTHGKILNKHRVNADRLPNIGKKANPKAFLSSDTLVKSSFKDFKNRIKEMRNKRSQDRGLNIKDSQIGSELEGKKKRKDIYKSIDDLRNLEVGPDKHALGLVESGGSFFNAFKPKDGVTIVESNIKVKKGNKTRSSFNQMSRLDYSKTYSQKPFELKGILTNSQSVRNLGTKKTQGISFYEESTLPPIMSPRNRYQNERENEITQEFELDQSVIPLKKVEDNIMKAGDISELVDDRNFLDNTVELTTESINNHAPKSILPKYINRFVLSNFI